MCLVQHIAVDEPLVNLVLALSHFADRFHMGLLVDNVLQLVIQACIAAVCGLFDHQLAHLVNEKALISVQLC